jgi:hypothetical protein
MTNTPLTLITFLVLPFSSPEQAAAAEHLTFILLFFPSTYIVHPFYPPPARHPGTKSWKPAKGRWKTSYWNLPGMFRQRNNPLWTTTTDGTKDGIIIRR